MDNTSILISILQSAREIGNVEIAKLAVSAIASDYGIVPQNRYKSLRDIRIYTPLERGNRLTAIKELRDIAFQNGLDSGLKEAKEEVDRRIAENSFKDSPSYW